MRNLENYGTQELDAKELIAIDGGSSHYYWQLI